MTRETRDVELAARLDESLTNSLPWSISRTRLDWAALDHRDLVPDPVALVEFDGTDRLTLLLGPPREPRPGECASAKGASSVWMRGVRAG